MKTNNITNKTPAKKKAKETRALRAYIVTEDSKERAMIDSGANINITSIKVAEKYGIEIIKTKSQESVQFGKKGSKSDIKGYGHFGSIIRKTAIIEDATETLIHVGTFVDKGMEVTFDEKRVYIRNKDNGETVCQGERDEESGLYYIDMDTLMRKEDRANGPTTKQEETKTKRGREIQKTEKKKQKGERVTRTQQRWIILLHQRMNHISSTTMSEALRAGVWEGIPAGITATVIEKVMNKLHCIACELAKRKTLPQQVGSGVREVRVGHTLSIDYVGPIYPPTMYGATGFYLFKEMASSHKMIGLVKVKSALNKILKKVIMWWRMKGKTVHKLRVDAGTVENSEEIKETIAELGEEYGGIEIDTTPPGSQEKNPVERDVQTMKRRITCLMISQENLTARYWGHAAITYVETENNSINVNSKEIGEWGMTPEQAVTGIKPNIGKFEYAFGTMVTCQKQTVRGTFEEKNELGVTVGTTHGKGGGKIVVLVGKGTRPYVRYQIKEVRAEESKEMTEEEANNLQYEETTTADGAIITTYKARRLEELTKKIITTVKKPWRREEDTEEETDEDNNTEKKRKETKEEEEEYTTEAWQEIDGEQVKEREDEEEEEEEIEEIRKGTEQDKWSRMSAQERHEETNAEGRHETRSRAKGSRAHMARSEIDTWQEEIQRQQDEELIEQEKELKFMIEKLEEEQGHENTVNKATTERDERNPRLQEAMGKYWEDWKEPVEKEKENIIGKDKGVVKEVKLRDIPRESMIVRMMVDLKTKINMTTGEIDKRKCRINCRGDQELKRGIHGDKLKLYSPTLRPESGMMLFAIATLVGAKICGWDVAGAFQKTPATREVYVAFPKELTGGEQKYYKLLRMLYGLPDASRAWYDFASEKLIKMEFKRCISDPCVFIWREGTKFVIVGIHVDDGADIANCEIMRKKLHDMLREYFEITEQDKLETQLGMHIEYNEDKSITISMPVHTEKTITTVYPEGTTIPEIHVPISEKWNEEENDNAPKCDMERWRTILGQVVWITRVRIDIILAVSRMCGRTHKATTKDMEHLEKLVAFIHFTKKMGRTFHPATTQAEREMKLIAYCDAAHKAYKEDSQAQLGYGIKIGGAESKSAMFSAASKKNATTTPLSSCGSELAASVEATKDVIYTRGLMEELGFPQEESTPIQEDNASLIRVTSDYNKGTRKMRQSMQLIHFMMDNIKRKVIELTKTKGEELAADNFTKPTTPKRYWKHIATIMGEHPDIEDARKRAGQKREKTEIIQETKKESTKGRETITKNMVNTVRVEWKGTW